jgi:hypothetical protein
VGSGVVAVEGVEVVPGPDAVDPEAVGRLPGGPEAVDGGVLGVELDADAEEAIAGTYPPAPVSP